MVPDVQIPLRTYFHLTYWLLFLSVFVRLDQANQLCHNDILYSNIFRNPNKCHKMNWWHPCSSMFPVWTGFWVVCYSTSLIYVLGRVLQGPFLKGLYLNIFFIPLKLWNCYVTRYSWGACWMGHKILSQLVCYSIYGSS